MKPDLISVVMPCYNAAEHIAESINCVLEQREVAVELIIVDDGSSDESVAIIKTFGERVRLIEQASGEYIAFLDADDWWAPDCLHKLYLALQDSAAALAYCGWQNVGKPGGAGEPYVPPDYERADKAGSFLRAAAPWPIHAALTRRGALDAAGGGFDEQWRTCMDYDLWLRVGLANSIVLVPETLAFYRHHGSSQITAIEWRQAFNVWSVKRHFVEKYPKLVSDVPSSRLRELIDGALLRRGYDALWKRDLISAQRIFRKVLRSGGWALKDLRYLLPALLPEKLFVSLVQGRG